MTLLAKGILAIEPNILPHSAVYYLKKGLAFFDLKAKAIPPVVFMLTLALSFAYYFLQERLLAVGFGANNASPPSGDALVLPLAALGCAFLMSVASSVYLRAAILEAKGEDFAASRCVVDVLKNVGRVIVAGLLKNLAIFVGLLLLIVPGVMTALEYLFAECAILDGSVKVQEAFKCSRRLTRGKKMPIFLTLLFCNLVIFIFIFSILWLFVGNDNLVFVYSAMFLMSIYNLMMSKLLAHIYVDLASPNRARRREHGSGREFARAYERGQETEPESERDLGREPRHEPAPRLESEPVPEPGTEQEAEREQEPGPVPERGTEPESAPRPEPESAPRPESEPAPGLVPEPVPEQGAERERELGPEQEAEQ